MTRQVQLFAQPRIFPDVRVDTGYPEWDAAFAKYDEEHPRVWRLFVKFTMDAIESGLRHYSAEAVVQRIRWEVDVTLRSRDRICMSNACRRRYGLKFMQTYTEHKGFFRTRRTT